MNKSSKRTLLYAHIVAIIIFLQGSFLTRIGYSNSIGIIYYISVIGTASLLLLRSLLNKESIKINVPGFLFLLACFLSLLLNDLNPIFKSWQRFIPFIFVLLFGGVFITSSSIIGFNKIMLHTIKFWSIIVSVASFIVGVLGIHLLPTYNTYALYGVTNQSMFLCPTASIATLFLLKDLTDKNKVSKKKFYQTIVLTLITLATVFMAASRGAIGAFLTAILLFIILYYRGLRVVYYIIFTGGLFLFIYYTNPYGVLDNVFHKMEQREDASDITSGRDVMFADRIKDFENSPIIGVGLFQMKELANSKYNRDTGVTESGSSWLSILSGTGLLGILAFLFLILKAFRLHIHYKSDAYLLAMLTFFLVHSMIEGYILGVGAPLGLIFWILIGTMSADNVHNI